MKIFAVSTPGVSDIRDRVFLPSIKSVEPDAQVQVENLTFEGNGDFWNEGFRQAIEKRLECIIRWVDENRGHIILVSDLDIRYLTPFTRDMLESLDDKDIAFQRETPNEGVNIGQMVIRCSEQMGAFFRKVLHEYQLTGEYEQVIINRMLGGINYCLLPLTFANTKTGFRAQMRSFHAICTRPKDGLTSTQLKFILFDSLQTYLKKTFSMSTSTGDHEKPYCVAIVAMGPSHAEYVAECLNKSSRFAVADETWAINAMGGVINHDRLICMDALPYFAKAARSQNPALAGYGDWLHRHTGPIYTQREYEGFPGSVEYPLREVIEACNGYAYFNSTVAYAVGLAILMQVDHLKLYGVDFTGAADADGQKGRACVEYWLSFAITRGMKITIASTSTLCDQKTGRQLYGYSSVPGNTG